MPCYTPLVGVDVGVRAETGRIAIQILKHAKWKNSHRLNKRIIPLPCGKCIGCRLERSRQWALRCVNEASLYENNMFITLTFNDEHVDKTGSLVKEDFQKFMKRLRKSYRGDQVVKNEKGEDTYPIRYFHCGEYGEKLERPHHHACIFNFEFKDKVLWDTRNGVRLFRSKCLERLWSYGYSTIGEVTFDSAAYVARYITKKINGLRSDAHYGGRLPEYTTMSRRPGIGKDWFNKFGTDVYDKDEIAVRRGGRIYVGKPPKYYDKLLERSDPGKYELIKERRVVEAKENPNNTVERLQCRHEIKLRQTKRLKRRYESNEA